MNEKSFDELTPSQQEDARCLADDFLLNHPEPIHYTSLQALYVRSRAAFEIVMNKSLLKAVKKDEVRA
jgi:hypothetical protein